MELSYEELKESLAEAQKLVRFWAHQHTLNMKLLQDKEQRIATLEDLLRARDEAFLKLEQDLDRLQAQLADAIKMLSRFMKLVNDGWLVRNTSSDSNPQWAMKQVEPVIFLSEVNDFLSHTEKETS